MRRLGYVALAAVITQGVLGGITVLWYLPDAISIAHASLAQIVFCLTAAIALATSPAWKRGYDTPAPDDRVLQRLAIDHDRCRLPADSGRRDHAAYGRRPGHS